MRHVLNKISVVKFLYPYVSYVDFKPTGSFKNEFFLSDTSFKHFPFYTSHSRLFFGSVARWSLEAKLLKTRLHAGTNFCYFKSVKPKVFFEEHNAQCRTWKASSPEAATDLCLPVMPFPDYSRPPEAICTQFKRDTPLPLLCSQRSACREPQCVSDS